MRFSCVCVDPSLSKQHGRVHLFALCGRQVYIQHGQVCLFLSHAALFHCISRRFSLMSSVVLTRCLLSLAVDRATRAIWARMPETAASRSATRAALDHFPLSSDSRAAWDARSGMCQQALRSASHYPSGDLCASRSCRPLSGDLSFTPSFARCQVLYQLVNSSPRLFAFSVFFLTALSLCLALL
jgi:hypothetical protein